MSIRRKLTLSFVIIVLLPGIVISLTSGFIGFRVGEQQIINQLESVAALKEAEIQTWMATLENDLAAVVAEPDLARHARIINDIARTPESRNLSRVMLKDRFDKTVNLLGRFDAFFLMDTEGTAIVATDLSLADTSHADQAYFREGSQGAFVSSPLYIPELEQTIIIFTQPLTNNDGETMGVLAGRTNLATLSQIMLERTGLGETGETYLVGTDHTLLTPSRFEADGYVAGTTNIDTDGAAFALEDQIQGAGRYHNYRGADSLGVYRWIPELQVALLAEQEQQEAFGALVTMMIINAGVTVGALLFSLVVAFVAVRDVTTPLANLVRTAARLASGDLTQRTTVRASDEMGDLAKAFNAMAANLQTMVQSERESKDRLENTVFQYMEFVEAVASGDLRLRLQLPNDRDGKAKGNDNLHQLGENLNSMVANLEQMTKHVRDSALAVSSAATEIQAATTQQAASAIEQDTTVLQTATTLEEIRQMVLQTSERAQMVADTAQESIQVSGEGESAIDETADGMELIRHRVESIADNILVLSEHTQQIGEIIATVDSLADRSKLLALNASIEAARAGEEGKGFAVVALEVRKMAEQSREATVRVGKILNEIQRATNTAVMVTEEGGKGAESGMVLVGRAGKAIRELATTIAQSAQAAQQIAASTHQQSNAMDQLSAAISQIKTTTMQTTVSTQQTEASVRDLLGMAQQLNHAVERYQLSRVSAAA